MPSVSQNQRLEGYYLRQHPPAKKRKKGISVIKKFDDLSSDVIQKIFSLMDARGLSNCLGVSKNCQMIANHDSLWKSLLPPFNGFGKEQWAERFRYRYIDKLPSLPRNIYNMLKSSCSFFPRQKIENTHLLMLIPKNYNVWLNNLSSIKEGRAFPEGVFKEFQWVLMAKPFIMSKPYDIFNVLAKQIYLDKINERKGLNYKIPELSQVMICEFIYSVQTGKNLFNPICTWCHSSGYYGVHGNFNKSFPPYSNSIGLAPLLELS